MDTQTLEPTLHIRFTNDFTAVKVDGEVEDSSSFSVTLMTAIRTLSNGAEPLSLGPIKSIRGINAGAGFALTLDESGHNLKKFDGVALWSDLSASIGDDLGAFPVIPAKDDLVGWVDQMASVRWRGLRSQADDAWSHYNREPDDQAVNSPFALAVLQVDLLIRNLKLPRRQLQVQFEEGVLMTSVNEDSDFLLVLSDTGLKPSISATLERCLSFFCWPL